MKTVRVQLANMQRQTHKILRAGVKNHPGEMQIKNAANHQKWNAAVLLAPPARLELTTFRLGVWRSHSVFFSTSSTVSSRFISCCTADTPNRKLSL